MTKPLHKLNKFGFTLIEVVVTMAVLVILIGMSIPSLTAYSRQAKLTEMQNHQELIQKSINQYYAYMGHFPDPDPTDGAAVDGVLTDTREETLREELLKVTTVRLNTDYVYTYNENTGECTLSMP